MKKQADGMKSSSFEHWKRLAETGVQHCPCVYPDMSCRYVECPFVVTDRNERAKVRKSFPVLRFDKKGCLMKTEGLHLPEALKERKT